VFDVSLAAGEPGPCCCDAEHFTERELDVLCAVATGAPNDEVAAGMNISAHTVAGHVLQMLRRTRARNRAELVARAYAAGILVPLSWPPSRTGRRCLQYPRSAPVSDVISSNDAAGH
jgi:DNA-binding CsgD family transcriptional regulator